MREHSLSLLTLMLLLTACGGDSAGGLPALSPGEELRAAARTIEMASSFRVIVEAAGADTTTAGEVMIYNAPDRLAVFIGQADGAGPEIVVVGADSFLAVSGRPGFFTKQPTQPATLDAYPLFATGIIDTTTAVSQDGDTYTFQAPLPGDDSRSISGKAWVSGGVLVAVELALPTASGTETVKYSFDRVDAAPDVVAPDPSRILPGDAIPACGEDGSPPSGSPVCFPSPLT